MTLEEYRRRCYWSIGQLARASDLDYNTIINAVEGQPIRPATAKKLADAISKRLNEDVKPDDIEGLNIKF